METRDEKLKQLEELLRRKPHTAREIQKRLKYKSKMTAYARVAALSMRGLKIAKEKVREGLHGPESNAFFIAESGNLEG